MLSFLTKKRGGAQDAIKDMLKNVQLQSFPVLIMEVLNDLRDPDMSLGAVARKLEGDPGMQVKILQTVNSAAFGLSREVTNLHSAIGMMGHARLESILLTHAVKGSLPAARTSNFNMKTFWTAASRRACLARGVAQRLHPATQVEAFTAGLLLDMAVPVLVRGNAEAYSEILAGMSDRGRHLHELEADRFSFDHADLGEQMAREWKLPAYLVNAIADHHRPDPSESVDPGVRIASLIRHDVGPASLEGIFELADQAYDLKRESMKQIITEAFAEAEEFTKKIT